MAIATDSYENIVYSGSTVTRIGLSKSLNNYSLDELYAHVYCSYSNRLYKLILERQNSNINTYADVEKVPYVITTSGTQVTVNNGIGEIADARGDYQFIVWLKGSRSEAGTYSIYQYQLTDFKMVTEWDAPNYYYKLPDPVSTFGTCATAWDDDEATIKTTWSTVDGHGELFYRYVHSGTINDISLSSNSIYPYAMFKRGSRIYLKQLRQNAPAFMSTVAKGSDYYTGGSWLYSVQPDDPGISVAGGNFVNPAYVQPNMTDTPQSPFTYYYDEVGISRKNRYCRTSDNAVIGRISYNGSNPTQYLGIESYFSNKYQSLLFWAGCGIKFYADKLYKPIIKEGYVEDYTDNMDDESDLDNWSGDTKHDVPITPPTPPTPPGPYDDDPWNGASFSGVGVGGAGAFAKVYYMTSTELANLRSWMNSINVPEGFDPMQQIIGLSQVPIALSGSAPENVVFVNSSAVYDPGVTTRAVDTGVATQQAMGTPISYYLGSVDIVRRMQERGEPYLDYDCQIELYLPLIGMFSLDTQAVMGRTISAYAILDPVSGTLAAYAYVTKNGQNLPVAYGSTTIGVDLPISAQQLSVSRAALKQANAQLGASLLSGALTMLAAASSSGRASGSGAKTSTGSSGLSAAGIREAGSDYMKASQVGNVFGDFMNWGRTIRQLSYGNNTAIAGSFGGSTAQWAYPFTPYVKIIRPRYEKPSNYNHSQGVPCVQTKTIGSCTGFIQCIGADVSGISGATDLELQAIQAALSNGIYAGGGQ